MIERDSATLAAFVSQDDAALFVGSGISMWSGLPSWRSLIHGLIDHAGAQGMRVGMAQSALRDGRLADAADALDLAPLEIAKVLRDQMKFDMVRPHPIHELLTSLGPQRFITTNYDTLIEQQLGLEARLGQFRTVTANRVAEMADILKASADRFIFKPHGDIGDAETMILAARHYERIMLGGRNLIRQGLETLLVSRPTLFLGFGLRDPDLNLILRSLTDNYRGNVHHLYAVVANLTEEEGDYWWQRFRIRAFGYQTRTGPKGEETHEALIELLKAVIAKRTRQASSSALIDLSKKNDGIGRKAGLTRYAAGLVRDVPDNPIDLRGRLYQPRDPWPDDRVNFLNGWPLRKIVEDCPVSMTLVGGAGTGKSHALADFLSHSASRILAWQANETGNMAPPIPVLLDARLYNGSFDELLRQVVPDALDLFGRSALHRIDIVIDSIDEMPQIHLEGGVWRNDLARFLKRFDRHRVIYGSRRAELVGDPTLPVFYIDPLQDNDLKRHLAAAGLSVDSFANSMLEEVTSPFLLSLILEFGNMVVSAGSITGLLACAIQNYLARLPQDIDRDTAEATLRELAHRAVVTGRETIAIDDFRARAADQFVINPDRLLEALVRSGLFVSEIEAQVRFVHRSMTEYLCSSHILTQLTTGALDLAGLLENHRWDAPITWALSTVGPDHARTLLPLIYAHDPVLAMKIVLASEQHRVVWWQLILMLVAENPPTNEELFAIRQEDDYQDVPSATLPALQALAHGENSEVRCWVWLRYAQHASEGELIEWLDKAAEGRFDFNECQWTAPEVGAQLGAKSEVHFLARLARLSAGAEDIEAATMSDLAADAAYCYAHLISGLQPQTLERLLKWSSSQSPDVRAIICRGLGDIVDTASNRFLFKQLDRRFFPACFPLYLSTRYAGRRKSRRPVPRFTTNRFDAIAAWIASPITARWALHLLQVYVERSPTWTEGVRAVLPTLSVKLRRAIQLILPSAQPRPQLRFVLELLKNPGKADELDLTVARILADTPITLPEDDVLTSIIKHGVEAIAILDGWFGVTGDAQIEISAARMDDWIACLAPLFPRKAWPAEAGATHLFGALARGWSFDARGAILRRANDPSDSLQDFILSCFVLRLTGFSMSELSSSAAEKLLEMYLDGEIDPYPSPGEVATDEFIESLVLPKAETVLTQYQREQMGQILYDAGGALGRRFRRPPLVEDKGSATKRGAEGFAI